MVIKLSIPSFLYILCNTVFIIFASNKFSDIYNYFFHCINSIYCGIFDKSDFSFSKNLIPKVFL